MEALSKIPMLISKQTISFRVSMEDILFYFTKTVMMKKKTNYNILFGSLLINQVKKKTL